MAKFNAYRKPSIVTAGLPMELAKALEPVKQAIESITGARAGTSEMHALAQDASIGDVINKINEIITRLNASGTATIGGQNGRRV